MNENYYVGNIALGVDSVDHELIIQNSDTGMVLFIKSNSSIVFDCAIMEDEQVLKDIFKAHEYFMTKKNPEDPDTMKINNYTFTNENMEETFIDDTGENISMVCLSTKNIFSVEKLNDFHMEIIAAVKELNKIEL